MRYCKGGGMANQGAVKVEQVNARLGYGNECEKGRPEPMQDVVYQEGRRHWTREIIAKMSWLGELR